MDPAVVIDGCGVLMASVWYCRLAPRRRSPSQVKEVRLELRALTMQKKICRWQVCASKRTHVEVFWAFRLQLSCCAEPYKGRVKVERRF